MAFKLVVLAAVLAVARAGVAPLAYAQAPLAYAHGPAIAKAVHVEEPYDPNPQYSYAYDVHDGLTGDAKSQQETRSGDVVQGSYSVVEADGTRRVVEYTADDHNGFNAVVHKEGVAVKTVAAAPVVKTVSAAPVAYAAPAAYAAHSYAAPAAYATHSYAAPAAYAAHSYAAPAAYAHAGPAVYSASFSSPHVTYSH